ncbi:helix-turn-helix domain-containing protein [Jeotgalibaca sp. MA1X17-3]|uniref:helix-turn-helix transcriptional regulator n=1 Tax=Jeotgalibaca sp. MA1X17-3 TaxID=2908211 RepID=UPI001F259BBD|nr:helix-turn-helix domain-containing protein [Jeotgalibaca sp. MA1X17-3]UJF15011.1 helix-turn-helix domain-containing protein [Jeotgalibaca sp. MA1X17-3]
MNGIVKYRKYLGYTQKEIAEIFGISRQAYYRKEKGYTPFSDKEKIVFRDMVKIAFPDITIGEIFLMKKQRNTKK